MSLTRGFWKTPAGLAFLGFALVAAVYLYVEHRVHLVGYAPLVIFLALCLGMHFMHGGHRHGGHRNHGGSHEGHDDADQPDRRAEVHQHGR